MLTREWFSKAISMKDGDSLLVQVKDKREQTVFVQQLNELKEKFAGLYPIEAAKLSFEKVFKGTTFWVRFSKSHPSSMTGFVRDANGVLVNVLSLESDPDRTRKIQLMLRDGYSVEDMSRCGIDLTEDEISRYFGQIEIVQKLD